MIVGVWKSGFKIKKKDDIATFLNGLKSHIDIKDVNDPAYYVSISKSKDGRTLVGYTRYGKDPIMAPPIVMVELEQSELYTFLYKFRKSINQEYFYKENTERRRL